VSGQVTDGDSQTHVIFSLSVNADEPIHAFAHILDSAKATVSDYFYDFGTTRFDESEANARAERLETAVIAAIDSLESTGVTRAELERDDVLVRAYFTFGPGAETISANLVQRLAKIQATIWIDA
jgi:hypothetical protein